MTEFSIQITPHPALLSEAIRRGGRKTAGMLRQRVDSTLLAFRSRMIQLATASVAGKGLNRRSGALVNSIRTSKISPLSGVVFSTSPYAQIHSEGGVIRPVKGKYLTVPLPEALTPTGQLRGKFRLMRGAGRTAAGRQTWGFEDGVPSVIIRTRSGALVMFRDQWKLVPSKRTSPVRGRGKRKAVHKLVPAYVLKRSVRINAAWNWGAAAQEVAVDQAELLRQDLQRIVRDFGGRK